MINPSNDSRHATEQSEDFNSNNKNNLDTDCSLQSKVAKPIKILRAESARVIAPVKEIENFSRLMNERISQLVNTLKRWGDGGFGSASGEDPILKSEMQTFVRVALENVPASFLVRVLSHFERGDESVYQSAKTVITGAERRIPSDGPLEKAIAKGDTAAVEDFRTYLKVVDKAAHDKPPFTPLRFLSDWREELGSKWVDQIVDDATQYLRHYVKLEKLYQENEEARLNALTKFKESARGKKYLEFRKQNGFEGLPKNREARFKILNTQEAVTWQKKNTKLVPAKDLRELMMNNPEIVALVKADIEFRWLTKENTPPSWTPISMEKHPRWPFIPSSILTDSIKKGKNTLSISISLPQSNAEGGVFTSNVNIDFETTTRFRQLSTTDTDWVFGWPDDISKSNTQIKIKGFRFEKSGNYWMARFSYEKSIDPFSERVNAMYKAIKNKMAPTCQAGDIVCSFSLDAVTKGGQKNHNRVGWFQVYGITNDGAKLLSSKPITSTVDADIGSTPNKRGRAAVWKGKSIAKQPDFNQPTRGQSSGATLPQLFDKDRELKREIRLLRLLKTPERIDEALEWVGSSLKAKEKKAGQEAARGKRNVSKEKELERWRKLYKTLEDGELPNTNQLKPFKDRIKDLRDSLRGMKNSFRNSVAKQVIIAAHETRIGKLDDKIHAFQERYPNGETLLVTEYRKGTGPGPYKPRPQNRTLAILGPSEIHSLISEKALMLSKAIPEFSFVPTKLRKECPSCEHENVNPPKEGLFDCESESCDEVRPAVQVATYNLAKTFFIPCEK